MSATIKDINIEAKLIEFGCVSTEGWGHKMFFTDQTEAELLELAHNVHDRLCPTHGQERDYSNLQNIVGDPLPQ